MTKQQIVTRFLADPENPKRIKEFTNLDRYEDGSDGARRGGGGNVDARDTMHTSTSETNSTDYRTKQHK